MRNISLKVDSDRCIPLQGRGTFRRKLLFCEGRIDFQIKLHGLVLGTEDIDDNIEESENPSGRNGSFDGGWKK